MGVNGIVHYPFTQICQLLLHACTYVFQCDRIQTSPMYAFLHRHCLHLKCILTLPITMEIWVNTLKADVLALFMCAPERRHPISCSSQAKPDRGTLTHSPHVSTVASSLQDYTSNKCPPQQLSKHSTSPKPTPQCSALVTSTPPSTHTHNNPTTQKDTHIHMYICTHTSYGVCTEDTYVCTYILV